MQATTSERIQALENTRAATFARMEALSQAAAGRGDVFNAEEETEFQDLDTTLARVDNQIVAERRIHDLKLRSAAPITAAAGTDGAAAAQARQPAGSGIRVMANVQPGIPFARYAMAMARAEGNRALALQEVQANRRWMDQTPQVADFLMASIGAGTRTGSGWADDLVYATNLTQDFVDILRPLTIVGRLPLRPAPFNVRLGTKTSGTTAFWVGEAKGIPMSKFATGDLTMTRHKLAGLTSITEELALDSSPSAEMMVRDDLRDSIIQLMDDSFIDPERAEVSGVSPASVINGVTAVAPTGTTAAALRTDIATLMGKFDTALLSTAGGYWIMSQGMATKIGLMVNALGQREFPDFNPANGTGTFLGFPAIISQTAVQTGSPAGGDLLIFLLPREIMIADDGAVDVRVSREATIEMSNTPTGAADTPANSSSPIVSMFQTDSLAVRAIRFVTWKKRRADVAQFINDANYQA